jgi:hypothetical protein
MSDELSQNDMIYIKSWSRTLGESYDIADDGKLVKIPITELLEKKKDAKLYVGLWSDRSLNVLENLIKLGYVITYSAGDEYTTPNSRIFLTKKGIELMLTVRSFNEL